MSNETNVPYAALIHSTSPTSGAYSGMSVVLFPVPGAPCLIAFCVDTGGISPDDEILGRPGHARAVQAIGSWPNATQGNGRRVAWAKHDPVRIDEPIPPQVARDFQEYAAVFAKYGNVLYGIYRPHKGDAATTKEVLAAFLDLMFEARGYTPLSNFTTHAASIRAKWFAYLMPTTSAEDVISLLDARKYAVIQGPPGTGKTRMAGEILAGHYAGNGRAIQFHPNTTYENFVGGLAPVRSADAVGLQFAPTPGFLMEAAVAARNSGKPYLLHIDEINRADIAKVLGEAIYLLEPDDVKTREIGLPYDFPGFGRTLALPENLHILGTMNSADRSLAIVDVAVRRRFAFTKLWPQLQVVEQLGGEAMQEAFKALLGVFTDYASDEALDLVPGHSYFLEKDDVAAKRRLETGLVPLLEEYLAQGYVGGFSEQIRAYLQWLESR